MIRKQNQSRRLQGEQREREKDRHTDTDTDTDKRIDCRLLSSRARTHTHTSSSAGASCISSTFLASSFSQRSLSALCSPQGHAHQYILHFSLCSYVALKQALPRTRACVYNLFKNGLGLKSVKIQKKKSF
jgi:hypothetical protein